MKMSKEHIKLNVFKLNHNVFLLLTSSFSVFSFPLGAQATFHSLWSLPSHVWECSHSLVSIVLFFITKSYLILCNLMDCSMPGSSVLQYLLEFAQLMSIELVMWSNHLILWHPLILLPSIFPSINQDLFQSWLLTVGGQSIEALATVFLINIQGWFPLELTSLISLQSKGLSSIFSSTSLSKHQFFSTQPSLWSNSHIRTWLLEKP